VTEPRRRRDAVLVIGGTGESRAIADALAAAGYPVLLSVVTEYAADLARRQVQRAGYDGAGLCIRQGALDDDELQDAVAGAAAVVDASHPFAGRITPAARAACERAGVPYLRYERQPGDLGDDVRRVPDADAAARLAVTLGGHGAILLTVGTRTLKAYVEAAQRAGRRIVARVLPTEGSLQLCRESGLPPSDVIAMQGPTSSGLDEALLRHLGATVLVSKDSGEEGGVQAKVVAARAAGAAVVVVARPSATADTTAGDTTAAGALSRVTHDAVGAVDQRDGVVDDQDAVLDWAARTLGHPVGGDQCDHGGYRRQHRESGPPHDRRRAESLSNGSRSDNDRGHATRRAAGTSHDVALRLSHGLLQVYTGDGKGKSTAAAGLALRARGRGLSVALVQFLKGGPESGELGPLRAAGVAVVRPAVKPSGTLRGAVTAEDRRSVAEAWVAARRLIAEGLTDVVVLDELHAALRRRLVDIDEVVAALMARPGHVEVVTTGRGAPPKLCEAADLITEMVARRHPYPDVPARKGVEL